MTNKRSSFSCRSFGSVGYFDDWLFWESPSLMNSFNVIHFILPAYIQDMLTRNTSLLSIIASTFELLQIGLAVNFVIFFCKCIFIAKIIGLFD